MKRTVYISVFGLNLSVINNFKKIINELLINQYEISWTHIANKNLQILLINEDFIDVEHIQKIDKTSVHILKLSKNEKFSGEVQDNTLYLPLKSISDLHQWLINATSELFKTKETDLSPVVQSQLYNSVIRSAFRKIDHKYTHVTNFVIKDSSNILAVFDKKDQKFYLNTDIEKYNFENFDIVPATLDHVVHYKQHFQAKDLNHGIWQFIWNLTTVDVPEYHQTYRLISWPQPIANQQRREILKISAYFSHGCTSQLVSEKMKIDKKLIDRYLFSCEIANLIEEIPENNIFIQSEIMSKKQQENPDIVLSIFGKLRKRLGL